MTRRHAPATTTATETARRPKLRLATIREIPIDQIRPAPENDRVYRPPDADDPDMIAFADSIRKHGVLVPLTITADGWVLNGHRRLFAAGMAGLETVPCQVIALRREDDPDEFLRLLREYNRQREKSLDEKLREEVISCNQEEAYEALTSYRAERSRTEITGMDLGERKRRPKITKAKDPLVNAILKIINDLEDVWPLCVRQIHYGLLNDPPPLHANRPDDLYCNDERSSDKADELLVRLRLTGQIPMHIITDDSRPVQTWNVHRDAQAFLRRELERSFRHYYRDLMQSQPNQIEIFCEKNTIFPILHSVAAEYCIPITSGHGMSSLPPRHAMAERFRKSGKERLIVLCLSDHDPAGKCIAESFARSMRDDFDIEQITGVQVALIKQQVLALHVPGKIKPKPAKAKKSSVTPKFVKAYGRDTYELEALPPAHLQHILRDAINSVIDVDLFNAEVDKETEESVFIDHARQRVHAALGELADEGGDQ